MPKDLVSANVYENILVFQIASLGDTVVSIPTYREIARRHPGANLHFLTNFPVGQKMVTAEQILAPLNLFSSYVKYPMPLRGASTILELRKSIRELKPQKLYYLLAETKVPNMMRHFAFFKMCGIPSIEGIPWSQKLRFPLPVIAQQRWESEASRLLRTIKAERQPGPPPEADRSLNLAEAERTKVEAALQQAGITAPFIAISVGGKVPVNNWGDPNWSQLLEGLSCKLPGYGLALVGSNDERARNEALAAYWAGPKFNTCGLFTPRQTAALLERAALYIGHDTGTLHLTAAVNTPILGVFSARNKPGKWFSDRPADRFLYSPLRCMGCELVEVADCPNGRRCIMDITPKEVIRNAIAMLIRPDTLALES
ncbi:MAG TPA: glycosyltransferase family 9 protein [Bryobacteraceae bacterium]|jgi:ADP-heptose:LPS heptosyltransferase|nr:glycosyltransferase family 9 protein [Bryobacteraceae bacterium]